MAKIKPPPKDLIDQRPALAGEVYVQHPNTSPSIGEPPRKYTRAVHERIVEELKKGQRPQGACARAGITLATFHEWVRRGKAKDPWLYEFAEDVEIAYNTAEATALEAVTEGFRSTDPAIRLNHTEEAKWFLERARPDGYSKQVKTAVEGQIMQFMVRLEAALDPLTFEKVLAVYLGQSPAAELGNKEVAQLPEHGDTEEASNTSE